MQRATAMLPVIDCSAEDAEVIDLDVDDRCVAADSNRLTKRGERGRNGDHLPPGLEPSAAPQNFSLRRATGQTNSCARGSAFATESTLGVILVITGWAAHRGSSRVWLTTTTDSKARTSSYRWKRTLRPDSRDFKPV
jgi:hypothetical protein